MRLTRLQLFALLLLAQVSFGAQSGAGQLGSHARTPISPGESKSSYDLQGYIAELERWSALAGRLENHPDQAGALRKQLPDSWSVEVQQQRFNVSTRPLGDGLDRIVRDPSAAARSAQEISGRVERLLEDARATYRTSTRNYSAERSMLDQILKQREFRYAHEEADSETIWGQLLDRLGRWVAGLLDRVGNHPRVTNFLRWGIVILLGLILLGWLAHALTQNSYQRSPALARDTRPAPGRDWAEEARSAAARGEFREAIRLVYGAAVLALGEAGAWQVERSRTHREYLRLLPADSAHRPHLVALTDCFERVWYGRAQASDCDYEAALAELESLR